MASQSADLVVPGADNLTGKTFDAPVKPWKKLMMSNHSDNVVRWQPRGEDFHVRLPYYSAVQQMLRMSTDGQWKNDTFTSELLCRYRHADLAGNPRLNYTLPLPKKQGSAGANKECHNQGSTVYVYIHNCFRQLQKPDEFNMLVVASVDVLHRKQAPKGLLVSTTTGASRGRKDGMESICSTALDLAERQIMLAGFGLMLLGAAFFLAPLLPVWAIALWRERGTDGG